MTTTWTAIADELTQTLASFQLKEWPRLVETATLVDERTDGDAESGAESEEKLPDEVMKGRAQKQLLQLMKKRFDAEPGLNKEYKPQTEWKWLNQLLVMVRLKELTQAKIVVRGRKSGAGYDIAELLQTFYGKQIIASLKDKDGAAFNVSRRRVVDKGEYETIKAAFLKIKLQLPETIEPTKTEVYFSDAPNGAAATTAAK